MITSLFNDLDLFQEIQNALEYENLIEYKKRHKIKLTEKEYFFDTYLLRPSFVLNLIGRRL